MFKRVNSSADSNSSPPSVERITSVLGPGLIWHGAITGSGGVRIEGAFEGQIGLRGLLVVGETGRVTCDNVRANAVIVAGAVRGNITTHKLEIRSGGRVWGDVTTTAFVTDEGAFLRGQIRMEETVDLELEASPPPLVPARADADLASDPAAPAPPLLGGNGARISARKRKTAGQPKPTAERAS